MKTQTIFSAYANVYEQITSLSMALAYTDEDFARRSIKRRIDRRGRQCDTFATAIGKRIDQLQQLADVQAALIGEKNAEIARLSADLSDCMAGGRDYSDDLMADNDAGAIAGVSNEVQA